MNKRDIASLMLAWAVLLVILVFLLFPIYWMVVTGLKNNMEAYEYPPTFFPRLLSLESFRSLFVENNQFFVYYGNNFLVSAWTAAICCVLAVFTGYASGSTTGGPY